MLALGNGFCLPPPELDEFPALQPKVAPLIPQGDLLDRLNAVQQARGGPLLPRLPALFDTEARFIRCMPLLDPYASHRDRPADGPLEPLPHALAMPPERRLFVYFGAAMPGAGPLMEGLIESGLAADVYLRGATKAQRSALERPALRLFASPPPLEDRLAECSLVVHHGGLGTATTCLAVGRPQILVPRELERGVNARAVHALGVAAILRGKLTADQVASALRNAAAAEAPRVRAAEIARKMERGGPEGGLNRAVERCLSLIKA